MLQPIHAGVLKEVASSRSPSHVPHAHFVVVATTGQSVTSWGKAHATNLIIVPLGTSDKMLWSAYCIECKQQDYFTGYKTGVQDILSLTVMGKDLRVSTSSGKKLTMPAHGSHTICVTLDTAYLRMQDHRKTLLNSHTFSNLNITAPITHKSRQASSTSPYHPLR